MKSGYKRGVIIRDINKWVKENSIGFVLYGNWYCGITKHSDFTRINQHIRQKNILGLYFKHWNAENVETAHEIEVYFHKLGMANKPHKGGAKKESRFAYVFKIGTNPVDDIFALLGIAR